MNKLPFCICGRVGAAHKVRWLVQDKQLRKLFIIANLQKTEESSQKNTSSQTDLKERYISEGWKCMQNFMVDVIRGVEANFTCDHVKHTCQLSTGLRPRQSISFRICSTSFHFQNCPNLNDGL